jgi:CRP-like cAMP-binding protein
MHVAESILFKGLSQDFMREISDLAEDRNFKENQIIFNRGDSADYLYFLIQGHVNVFIQEGGSLNFTVDESGEVFGWSALVDPNIYTASAQCFEDTTVLRIDATRLEHVFDRFPKEAYRVMKRLAGVIGQRLAASYEDHLRSRVEIATPSYG